MLRKGDTVSYQGGTGKIDKTSTKPGEKIYRVQPADKWFKKAGLVKV